LGVCALIAEADILGKLVLTDGKEVAAKRYIEARSRPKIVIKGMPV
jgi:hypothetical protein